MRLRCEACGCYVHAIDYMFNQYDAEKYTQVQPCKRCLTAQKEPAYIKGFLEGFMDGTMGDFWWWPVTPP